MLIVLHLQWQVDLEFFVMLGEFCVWRVAAQKVMNHECKNIKNDHFWI